MALLFADSFATYSTVSELNNKWTTVSGSPALGTGQFSAPSLRVDALTTAKIVFKQLPSNTMKRIGFWYTGNMSLSTQGDPMTLRATATSANENRWMSIFGNGSVIFYDGANASVSVGTLTAGTLKPNASYWIELEVKSTGMKCYIDGLLVFSYTGSITVGNDMAITSLAGASNGITHNVSHLVVWDDTGSTFTAFPLGPQRTQVVRPTAAGSQANWTPASGANWQAVDSAGWGGGVGVSTLVTATDDLHNCTDMAWNSYRINSVYMHLRAVDLNTGGSSVAPLLLDASGTAVGTQVALPMTNPKIISQSFDKDSAGGDWTKTKIDAMQIGYRSQI